jgi:hypothetical protein
MCEETKNTPIIHSVYKLCMVAPTCFGITLPDRYRKIRQTQQKVIYCYTRQLFSTQLWGHHQAIISNWRNISTCRFTYFGKETKFITKLFKNTSVQVTHTTRNTIKRLLSTQNHTQKDKYEKSGVYKLTCPDCKKAYIGQTGRPFSVRFRENFRDYKHSKNKSKFAEHLLDLHHSFGPINTTMDILHLTSKWTMMNTFENYHIYNETSRDNQINGHHTVKPNATSNP